MGRSTLSASRRRNSPPTTSTSPDPSSETNGNFLIVGRLGDGRILVQTPGSTQPAIMTQVEFEAVWSANLVEPGRWHLVDDPRGAGGERVQSGEIERRGAVERSLIEPTARVAVSPVPNTAGSAPAATSSCSRAAA
jgi:hypothetical protein